MQKLCFQHQQVVNAIGGRDYSFDYCNGSLILKNGKPQMYLFDGGYYSFDGDKKPECHYYVQDYQGNNRMVVNADKDSIEQITHYYPYGGIIGNLSSNQEAQKYKYSGKALAAIEKIDNLRREREALAEGQDRTYGLDLYDFQARLFNPALPGFDRPDELAEKFTWLTPYNYCAGDPVNCVDPTGMDIVYMNRDGSEQKRIESSQNITYVQDVNASRYELNNLGAGGATGWISAPMPDKIEGFSDNYDYLIAGKTSYFNQDKNIGITPTHTNGKTIDDASTVPDLDPTLVKCIIANETAMGTVSGHGSNDATQDIMQANVWYSENSNDWCNSKTQFGLKKQGGATPALSVHAGIGILYQKGLKTNSNGNTTFRGWCEAARRYNGGGDPDYMIKINKNSNGKFK